MFKIPSFILLLALTGLGCARTNFFQPTALVDPAAFKSQQQPDSALVTVGRHYRKSGFHNLFFGKHYRELWATPVKLPVIDLNRAQGGLKPVSMGGGFQTTSLTLETKDGRPFVLRSLDKDPYKTLPGFLRKTFVVNVVRDQTSAGNPFAPLVIPPLSEAAGIYYTNPKLYYVAENDSSFGKYGDRIRGKVMLLEEKYDGRKALTPMFGKADDLLDSEDVLKDHYLNNKHQFDQQLFARSRLFDLLIADWDRHEGQWQWAQFKTGKTNLYQPVPKDRDQTFYKFDDGIITWLASRPFLIRKFQTFKDHYGYLPGWLFNARFIDARALNAVSRQDFKRHAEGLKASLTDEVLAQALTQLPPPVYQKNAAETLRKLKGRRDKLPQAADEMYLYLAREVLVTGSDEDEIFEVTRMASGETLVEIFREDEKPKVPFYSRTFKPEETRLIKLYALGGDDEIKISGESRRSIKLHVYGGTGEDELEDKSKTGGCRKPTVVYDTKRGIVIEDSKEVKKRLERDVAVHAFDREGL